MADAIVVATVATKMCAGVANLLRSLRHLGWEQVHVLGLGRKWTGFQLKIQEYHDFCEKMPSGTLVVLIDSFDALCVRGPEGFRLAFCTFAADIVCSAERLCGKKNCVYPEEYWNNPTNIHNGQEISGHKYLNSGIVIGTSQHLATMLRWALATKQHDDQLSAIRFLRVANEYRVRMELDAQSTLTFTEVALDYSSKRKWFRNRADGRITCRLNQTRKVQPWFTHYPSLLFHRVMLDPFQFGQPLGRDNYDVVGNLVLPKGEFMDLVQTSYPLVRTRNILMWVLFLLALFLLFVFLRLYVRARRDIRQLLVNTTSH